ncbi:ExeA family protein [Allosphingosinicella deserti]|uniref:General secretion pathway protein n=1 Tax=Allosphingosinicella deserti TaxID=2116704 RepID=A0A2P7QPH1_9SPHN|nr:AAA family ATPase [Sphingomonas deserti]PSJ39865.1 general secretion pathway protein [Sphingomonas deserti]
MYTDYYGLSARPFQLTPDARFWFDSKTHKKALAYLGYGIAQGEGFITITGEIGAGKSTLVAHLLATIDRERLNAVSLVSTQVEGDDMLRMTAIALGIPTTGVPKAQLLDRIEQQMSDDADRGKRTLLIVDEAQNLPTSALEELRMLSNYTRQGRALVQIFLLGQPEFRDRLATDPGLEQLRQRVIAAHHLDAMEPAEIEPYIVHRLAIAGWTGRPSFDAPAYAAMHRHSGGIPRKLNQLANRILLHGAIEQLDRIGTAAIETVVADMAADKPQISDRVHTLRPAAVPPYAAAASVTNAEPVRDLALERRVAALEAKVDEQDIVLRRVLTLLVEWVENSDAPGYRSNAA